MSRGLRSDGPVLGHGELPTVFMIGFVGPEQELLKALGLTTAVILSRFIDTLDALMTQS